MAGSVGLDSLRPSLNVIAMQSRCLTVREQIIVMLKKTRLELLHPTT